MKPSRRLNLQLRLGDWDTRRTGKFDKSIFRQALSKPPASASDREDSRKSQGKTGGVLDHPLESARALPSPFSFGGISVNGFPHRSRRRQHAAVSR